MKKYVEARLGKHIESSEKLRKFLTNDRKVLRFEGEWDDTSSVYGDRNAYILQVYLADDTIDVREVKVANSGKEPFPSLLARQRIPKDYATAKYVDVIERWWMCYAHFAAACAFAMCGHQALTCARRRRCD